MILSILIPSTPDRNEMFTQLVAELTRQINNLNVSDKVEIKTAVDNYVMTTGSKRNLLINSSIGKYVIFVDSDDWIPDYYIERLLQASESDADCFGIEGYMTTNGLDEKKWYISKDNPYKAERDENGKEFYLRFTNHITGCKREIAIQIPYADITVGEDYDYAVRLKNSGLLKTEYKLEGFPMYYYLFINTKSR